MSLKPVELQIALPRTHDAAKVQNSQQQRPALDQQQLAGQNVKHSQEIAMRSSEVDESSESALRDGVRRSSRTATLIRVSQGSLRPSTMPSILIRDTG